MNKKNITLTGINREAWAPCVSRKSISKGEARPQGWWGAAAGVRFQFDSSLDFAPDVGAEGWQLGRRTLFTGALGVLKTEVHVLTQGSYSKAILPPS